MKTISAACAGFLVGSSFLICSDLNAGNPGREKSLRPSETGSSEEHIILAVAGAHGTLSPVGYVTVRHGGIVTFSTRADSGYYVDSVIVDGVNQGTLTSYTFTDVSANHMIRATFTTERGSGRWHTMTPDSSTGQHELTISAIAGPHGSISPSGVFSVAPHGSVIYSIKADPGYSVDSVVVDGINAGTVTTYTFSNVMYEHTVRATFVKGK